MKNNLLSTSLFFILAFSMLFQDLFLQVPFGTIARCPVVFIVPVIFVCIIILQNSVQFNSIIKISGWYVLITNITGLLMLFITLLFFTHFNFYVYDDLIPVKFLKASSYNIVYLLVAICLYNTLNKMSLAAIRSVLTVLFLFLVVYAFLEFFFSFSIPFINFTETGELNRISLTASEPSTAACMFFTITALVIGLRIYTHCNKLITFIFGVAGIIVLMMVGSKTALLILPFTLLWAIRKKISLKIFFLSLLIIIPAAVFIFQIVIPQIQVDIDSFTSFSTRTTCWIASFESLFLFPLGEGYGTYLVHYPPLLLPLNDYLISVTHLPLLNTELIDMVSTGENLPGKSGIPNEIIYNGITAIVFFYFLFKGYRKNINKLQQNEMQVIFSLIGSFLFVEFLFGVVLETSYYYFIPFFVLDKICNMQPIPA